MNHIYKKRVLVAEDDKQTRRLITLVLELEGYAPIAAVNAEEALTHAESACPEAILLDLGLPDMDGMEVIRRVRETSDIPIIVVSARSENESIVNALEAGADDYITKPFAPEELKARLRVGLRRTARGGMDHGLYENGALSILYSEPRVHVAGHEIWLTPGEYAILCLLARNEGRIMTHAEILKAIDGRDSGDYRKLRVIMSTLRKKIQPDKDDPQYIQTHFAIGYRMNRSQSP